MNTPNSIIIETQAGLIEVWYEGHVNRDEYIYQTGWYAEYFPFNEDPRYGAIWGPYTGPEKAYEDVVRIYRLFAPRYEDAIV